LAEHAVASPVPYEGDDEWNDQSRYEYWNDIEYDSDGYNDVDGKQKNKAVKQLKPTGTLKRKAPAAPESPTKRRKLYRGEVSRGISPVAWRPKADVKPLEEFITPVEELKSFSLLKDWRERFRHAKGLGTPKVQQNVDGEMSGERSALLEEDDGEDEDGGGDVGEEVGAESADVMKLDPEILKMALRKNLESIGLDVAKINEATLLKLATRMTADMGRAHEILDEFVETLLGSEETEETDQFSQWALKKAEEAAKDQPQDEMDDQTAATEAIPSHSAVDETQAKVYRKQLEDNTEMTGIHTENSNSTDGMHTPGPSRGRKRKADSPTSPSRKKKVNHAPDRLRASS
jgi:hypothetical protein